MKHNDERPPLEPLPVTKKKNTGRPKKADIAKRPPAETVKRDDLGDVICPSCGKTALRETRRVSITEVYLTCRGCGQRHRLTADHIQQLTPRTKGPSCFPTPLNHL